MASAHFDCAHIDPAFARLVHLDLTLYGLCSLADTRMLVSLGRRVVGDGQKVFADGINAEEVGFGCNDVYEGGCRGGGGDEVERDGELDTTRSENVMSECMHNKIR